MKILRHHRDLPAEAKGAVIALGNFDGVHRGHRALIAKAGRIAREKNASLAVVVFEPYPREFFQPQAEPFRLTPFRAKARLLGELGIDWLIVIEFNAEMAARSPQDFVLDVLVGDLGIVHVVVGEDFVFGKGRAGDAAVLAYMGEMEGFGVTVFAPVGQHDGAAKISSTRIRAALKEGRPEEAANLLGHWWSVEGHVARGDGRGRGLGFPTANISLEGSLHPAHGIYAVRATIEGGATCGGVASFGTRPMFTLEKPLLEVHLFDFTGDLYGKLLRVEFLRFLRGEQKFDNAETLKEQMERDAAEARNTLAQNPLSPTGGEG